MFLVVFVTLVISVIGLFVQIYSLQTSRMYNNQTALMQTMQTWHATAAGMGINYPPTNLNGMTGCRMTSNASSALPGCVNGTYGTEWVNTNANLPKGYNTASYSFMTVAFQTVAPPAPPTSYIITYAHDTDATGSLLLPDSSGTSVGFSLHDLGLQFARSPHSNILYGTVTAPGTLYVVTSGGGAAAASLPYTIPTSIPVNSIAVISAAQ